MQTLEIDTRRRQDAYDLRGQIHSDSDNEYGHLDGHGDAGNYVGTDDEEHSVMEEDSDQGEGEDDFIDDMDDGSSSLSIPNESIDFDLVYSLHSFAATVEGQANVVKGDSLFLMDDSNSYWWLVRVLKTQEVGYIPAENIETPFERLARLNKHRNVDLASPNQAELQENLAASQDRLIQNLSRQGRTPSPNTLRNNRKSVDFRISKRFHRYPPAIWREEEEDEEEDVEWDEGEYESDDTDLAAEAEERSRADAASRAGSTVMDVDDRDEESTGKVRWGDQGPAQPTQNGGAGGNIPITLRPGEQSQTAEQQQIQIQRSLDSISPQRTSPQNTLNPADNQLSGANAKGRISPANQSPISPGSSGPRRIDPLDQQETVRVTMTPSIARDSEESATYNSNAIARQEEERKRRLEVESEENRKRAKGKDAQKMAPPVSSASLNVSGNGGRKLQKERVESSPDDDGKDKKKKGGSLLGGLFSRRKDKDKKEGKSSISSFETDIRASEDSSRSGGRVSSSSGHDAGMAASPTTEAAMQQQQQSQQLALRNSQDPRRVGGSSPGSAASPTNIPTQSSSASVSESVSSSPPSISHLRKQDQEQQALYLQYLNRSPSAAPEPNYGTLPARFNNASVGGGGLGPPVHKPRPGSIILTPTPWMEVMFPSSATSSAELVKQAIQRFRLPVEGEDGGVSEYYLTIKQVEGSSAVLKGHEKPLEVFESLQAAMDEESSNFLLPKVKRSSVGSISSVSSNLSMHPAIKKLPMNDFTDDSAVKFYLNRRSADGRDSALDDMIEEEGDTLIAADTSIGSGESVGGRPQYLTVTTAGVHNVQPERFHSPSFRFAVQVSEAIVFKGTLKDRDSRSLSISSNLSGLSNTMRRKVFVFPKNATVAEVIEIGLERFGILEGVVDGGDEVEDKLSKRRSAQRVRYVLMVEGGAGLSHERELAPSSKILEAYSRPPAFRPAINHSTNMKRRSVDSGQLLGSIEDVSPDDPVFILRRATSYRNTSHRGKRNSAPLDELALRNLHRESASSSISSSDQTVQAAHAGSSVLGAQQTEQRSMKEIIAAQREASRANQRKALATQANAVRGVDVLYLEMYASEYDISDIVEEEFKNAGDKNDLLEGVGAGIGKKDSGLDEKLDRVLSRVKNERPPPRVETPPSASSYGSSHRKSLSTSSAYSAAEETIDGHGANYGSRSTTPVVSQQNVSTRSTPTQPERGVSPTSRSRSNTPATAATSLGSRMFTPTERVASPTSTIGRSSPALDELTGNVMRSGTVTPLSSAGRPGMARRNPSVASAASDISGYATPATHITSASSTGDSDYGGANTPLPKFSTRQMNIPGAAGAKNDFGVSHMMAVIEYRALASKPKVGIADRGDPVDEMLFGRKMDLAALHPKIRDVYASSFKEMEEMDQLLDQHLQQAHSTSAS
ncbi:hypothetical protein D9758_003865 [Tetrapyrgos nigripes]|uniref:SH3 domain-containing protein n=1 Tax=Tetrapyrgos nigripes TaxID=182062 RepID=A0A8H5GLN3_9AGAR|nr:hypothetical protein D9758_003865 [Tetrapyrgos nigripes]